MKLWYQSLARETEATPYGAILKRVIDKCADPPSTWRCPPNPGRRASSQYAAAQPSARGSEPAR